MNGGEAARVFVVDDDPSVRTAVVRLLRTAGFTVESFPSGAAFLEQVEPDQGGCLVLDVKMPSQSGFDLFERVAADRRSLSVIFITGHADLTAVMRRVGAPAANYHFLTKPFEADALIAAVRRALPRA
jgi:FixJ family two-component response regulator